MSSFRHAAWWVWAAVAGIVLATVPGLSVSAATTPPLELASSSPDQDQSLSAHPSAVRLVFAQDIGDRDIGITVVCDGQAADVGEPAPDPDGKSIEASLRGTTVGTCTVTWTVSTQSGQPLNNRYTFTIEPSADEEETATTDATATTTNGDETPATTTPSAGDTSSDSDSDSDDGGGIAVVEEGASNLGGPLGLARLASFVGILALFGALVLIALHWNEGVEYLVTLRYLRVIWVVGAVATVLVVILTTARQPGNSLGGAVNPAAWGDLLDTTLGKVLLARLLLVLGCGWVAWQPDRVTDPATQLVAIGVPGLAVVTLGFSRTGGPAELVGFLGGVMQALGASLWFGGLLLLTRSVLVGPGEDDLVRAVHGYIRLAPAAIAATVLGGVIQVYRLDGFALLTTGHGRLAILSAIAVGLAIYLGTATRQFASQRLADADHLDGRLAHRLRRAFTIEVLIGLVVLLLTSWMLALHPPKITAEAPRDDTTYAFNSQRSEPPFQVQVRLTSTVVGRVGVRLEVFEPAEGLSGLQMRFIPPPEAYADVPETAVVVPLDGAGAAVLPGSAWDGFKVSGNWTIDISATLPDGKAITARIKDVIVTLPGEEPATTTTPADGSTPAATGDTTAPDSTATSEPASTDAATGDATASSAP